MNLEHMYSRVSLAITGPRPSFLQPIVANKPTWWDIHPPPPRSYEKPTAVWCILVTKDCILIVIHANLLAEMHRQTGKTHSCTRIQGRGLGNHVQWILSIYSLAHVPTRQCIRSHARHFHTRINTHSRARKELRFRPVNASRVYLKYFDNLP